ncbi:Asp-tRNA(Asn)/Glu-tRNA(Gln) amidotransferase subunit GatB [Methanonatronarchaeum sp. AMET6-2]|uniref:Asp-tRNA(Asn)/Glu-tRNA(Gln) amidotransferase subunit GatB n=1 Tax=Methanonatronarchaeum sp. AMET6-2 TaxID=2933293 RepID=UPI0011F76CBA|nr:Asp-tRNA(Asn)/Glu-tRNA(Gln) amidotransferase subunit GatB [Methanonatronarchaeum sp. AMET6-2]RZN60867.1 MAG: Asp-tRNA(Asn)/Glu-tRNA(Gln) amidotransferase subunit GatB [Methanonatronarchaeia archaeon]UOY09565.1 Asp-tRNA(Asn)/Glu-tRNA(Gln) amidotransferase subunit GatB [Methanonatronarchaeum sp. AMET6-2]
MTETDTKIGLEVHIQLDTDSKLFCSCSTDYRESPPNTHTCPVCLGLPGSLPTLNQKVVEYGVMAGYALNCSIASEMHFHRKNYFYPDLAKGFQITQYDKPIATDGQINLRDGKEIRIRRIQIEEDPGRLVHPMTSRYTYTDYNRSGVPLLEIVTEPDLTTPGEAREFLNKIREILEYLGIFDGSLEGSLRCDANISIMGGGRAEVKNISSYKGAEKALQYELTRQKNLLRRNQEVKRETRHFDEEQEITRSARTKEEEHNYRYFPEPDIPQIKITEQIKQKAREQLPELPEEKRERFKKEYGVTEDQARSLTQTVGLAEYYEETARQTDPKTTATWISDVLKGELNYRDLTIKQNNIKPSQMALIIDKLNQDEITEKGATKIIRTMLDEGGTPQQIIEDKNLSTIKKDKVHQAVEKAIKENPEAVEDYHNGKKEAVNYLVGQVMKITKGKAKPDETNKIITKKLEENA